MAVTVASFRAHHPEFATTPADAVVQDAIDKAGRLLDAGVIPAALYDDAVEWQAYVYIGTSPYARDRRIPVGSVQLGDDPLATARRNLDEILLAAGRAYRVIP